MLKLKGHLSSLVLALALAMPVSAEELLARGVVRAWDEATLSSELAAKVFYMPLRNGDFFHAGDLLVGLECKLFHAQVGKVRSELEATKARFDNNKLLVTRNSISKLEVALSEIAVRQAESELHIAEINAERCEIRAPWDGRVVQRLVNVEESVELNKPLLSIVSTQRMELELVVPAHWVQWLKHGMTFRFQVDETNKEVGATVARLGSVVDPISQTMQVRASVDKDSFLLPGMSGTARFD